MSVDLIPLLVGYCGGLIVAVISILWRGRAARKALKRERDWS